MQSRILLVEDHKVLRDGLRNVIEKSTLFQVVGEAGDGVEAVSLTRELQPDVVLMDIGLPKMNGLDALSEMLRHCPRTHVVFLTMRDDDYSVLMAFRSGARGYLLKKTSSANLLDALRIVSQGGSYVSSDVSGRLLARIQSGNLKDSDAQDSAPSVTARERQVLNLATAGNSSKEIASLLGLSLETVRSYRKTLMKKLGARNLASLTRAAVQYGMIRGVRD